MSECLLDYKAEYDNMVETSKAAGRCSALKAQSCGKLNVAGLCVVRQQLWFVTFFCSFLLLVFCFCFFFMYQGINQYTGAEPEPLWALLKGTRK